MRTQPLLWLSIVTSLASVALLSYVVVQDDCECATPLPTVQYLNGTECPKLYTALQKSLEAKTVPITYDGEWVQFVWGSNTSCAVLASRPELANWEAMASDEGSVAWFDILGDGDDFWRFVRRYIQA